MYFEHLICASNNAEYNDGETKFISCPHRAYSYKVISGFQHRLACLIDDKWIFFQRNNCIVPKTMITEKAMAPHSSTLAWKIPWTEEPGRVESMRSLSQTRLKDFTFTFHFHALEKEMATHSSVLAWRILGMGEPGGRPSMESHRVRHD